MRTNLSEALPALIPEFPVEIAGHHLTLRFDVNINYRVLSLITWQILIRIDNN
jgi:hypothetical protein